MIRPATTALAVALLVASAMPARAQNAGAPVATTKTDAHRWQLRVRSGAVIPIGDLASAPIVGAEVAATRWGKLRLVAGADWTSLTQRDSPLVGPLDYPRARAELLQTSNVFGLWAGGIYDLLETRSLGVGIGAELGVSINRSKFTAFNMTVRENDVAPLFGARLDAHGPAGPLVWSVAVGYRETRHDLGDSGDFGESTMSGLLAQAGLGIAF